MTEDPERRDLRRTLSALDARQQKIVGGVLALMIENPGRVREREWITEQFTQVLLLACDFEDVGSVQEGQDRIREYARDHIDGLLNASYRLFGVVAQDLADRVPDGLTREEAVAHALTYFEPRPAGQG